MKIKSFYRKRGADILLVFLLMLLITALILTSCTNDEEPIIPIEKSYSDPVINLDAFKQQLLSATNGWEGTLSPQPGKMYQAFFELNAEGKVTLYSDIDTETAETPSITGYKVETAQKVNAALIFEAGSYLDRIVIKGSQRKVDLSYSFKSVNGDTLKLLGNNYSDELVLVKASKERRDRYAALALQSSLVKITAYLASSRFFYLEVAPGRRIQFRVNPATREVYVTHVNPDAKFFGSDYSHTLSGIRLRTPFKAAGYPITEMFWDDQTNELYARYNNTRVDLKPSPIPVIPLHYLLAKEYTSELIIVKEDVGLMPGWSNKFQQAWVDDTEKLIDEKHDLYYFIIDLDMETNTMSLSVYFDHEYRLRRGKFPYEFTKSADGIFDFTPLKVDGTDDEAFYARLFDGKMSNTFDVINNHRFRIDFFDAYSTIGLIPQFTSVEDPEIHFTTYFNE